MQKLLDEIQQYCICDAAVIKDRIDFWEQAAWYSAEVFDFPSCMECVKRMETWERFFEILKR